jgi:SpoIID/LytB domain protein
MEEPKVSVGIMFEPRIEFVLTSGFIAGGKEYHGRQIVNLAQGKIEWNGLSYQEILFEPVNVADASFELIGVTIGINFHWERKENQVFKGALKLIVEGDKITAINLLGIEDYLTSVISSEMSATASLELLKAHAVISRSWLMAQIQKNKEIVESKATYNTMFETENELIKWYDREDHTRFDICADDHCQRYQGITRASTDIVKQAISETRGELLMFDNKICDARYSKSCGGVFEEFQNCWENIKYPYLVKVRDSKTNTEIPDLTNEKNATEWILSSPEAFCNTSDKRVLSQVLNNYDQETVNFYRWVVEYNQQDLKDLILSRSGVDYGDILDLIPIERGTSGRLVRLKIVGSKRTRIIGKELEIRRTLSKSHLYSSAFVVEKVLGEDNVPSKFIIKGAGWGHGVGLCQIGAAVMGEEGYKYNEILLHYFVGALIEKLY